MSANLFSKPAERKEFSFRTRLILTVSAWIGYIALLLALYFDLGSNANSLAVLPVIVSAWFFGKRAGLLIGLLAYPFNIMFFWLLGYEHMDRMLALQALWPMIGMTVIGGSIGWARDTRHALRRELLERKRAESALILSGRIIESLAEGVMLNRVTDGKIVYANPCFEKMFGYEQDELFGRHVSSLNAPIPISSEETAQVIMTRLKESGFWKGEICNLKKDGTAFWCFASVSEFDHPDFGPVWVSVQKDISERKQAEAQIKELNASLELRVRQRTAELNASKVALEKALRLKDEFLASMSHEFRTPLTGILGLSEVLQYQSYGALNEKQLNALTQIESSGRRLLDLINNILDLANIESGDHILHISPFSLADVLSGCLESIKISVEKKKQQISFAMEPETVVLNADARRIRQIVASLLDNASKFTDEGGNLGLEVAGDQRERLVRIIVWDSGMGIRSEELPRLFQPFTQLDGRLAKRFNGTGLGLVLAKRLTELHGGSIKVESVFGHGSRFIVSLPWVSEQEMISTD